ncbi:hypothetical protein C5167_000656 [Papaver somniferum]|uniref:BHLH domain-containing protein n=1 Tax=Papaver somniferum TaxID=3469 RepID=A0A4Y7KWQ1_PAPSO|nr:transcription factor bHLH35-like [Papaver somniferum]RZC76531.1 hypothetical protein C5167_000656 [Papaver somniferum]
MELIDEEEDYNKLYWETNLFLQNDELQLDSWGLDEPISRYFGSSSPDGAASPLVTAKNIVSERNRRKKLNDSLFALRAVVPNISKMDKASTIKDATEYIEELHEQERVIQSEITELESRKLKKSVSDTVNLSKTKKKRIDRAYDSSGSQTSSIESLQLRIHNMGDNIMVVSLTCDKKIDTMLRLCEVFESLKLKIVKANISVVSGRLWKTVYVEADEEEKDELKMKIEAAIAGLNDSQSPNMSF